MASDVIVPPSGPLVVHALWPAWAGMLLQGATPAMIVTTRMSKRAARERNSHLLLSTPFQHASIASKGVVFGAGLAPGHDAGIAPLVSSPTRLRISAATGE